MVRGAIHGDVVDAGGNMVESVNRGRRRESSRIVTMKEQTHRAGRAGPHLPLGVVEGGGLREGVHQEMMLTLLPNHHPQTVSRLNLVVEEGEDKSGLH